MIRTATALAFAASFAAAQPNDNHTRVEAQWAPPGMIANPVAFTLDRFGRIYVVESYRAGNAVTDTRNLGHLNAVEEDLKLHSVEDRLALINKWIAAGAFEPDYFTRTEDRVVRVADTDDHGGADETVIFADGFNAPLDGIASGALWVGDTLLFTNIPNLWALRDRDGDGAADERESLAYGFGVRWCFYGHDLHGLVHGPDGRVYFSLGDRGFNVTTREGERLVNAQTGGVFRCWPDGSELELFAQGLRNPQELCFDEFGNLFTGDNNCDSGDRARVVHVFEGADCGWRQDVQSLDSRGPWNREKIWHTYDDPKDIIRPAWTLPPVAHVGAGPSGILYYPGTGESPAYDDHIFMVDFYGSGATVHTFRMEPAGAWFNLADQGEYYKGKTVTDIAFGYDGRMYLSDWGGGWSPNPNGSIFTITNTTVRDNAEERDAIRQVQSLFAEGFETLDTGTLFGLLAHRDQRVRLAAQFELAKPERHAAELAMATVADSSISTPQIARVHAVWLLSQIARRDRSVLPTLRLLLDDHDAEVRTQVVKMLGDLPDAEPAARYIELLADEHHPVRAYAALALGRIAHADAIDPLLDLLDANDDRDPVIRHAASYALALINRPDDLIDAALTRGEGARIGAVVALRRLQNLGLLAFLRDEHPRVAAEAVRGIYDERVDAALPAVARLIEGNFADPVTAEPVLRRALAANELLGDSEAAARLAGVTVRTDLSPAWRKTALLALLNWDQPLERESVWGHWVDLPARDESAARAAVLAVLPALTASPAADAALAETIDAARARFGEDLSGDAMIAAIADPSAAPDYRRALLERLALVDPSGLVEAANAALADPAPAAERLRIRALALLADHAPDTAFEAINHTIDHGTTRERQHAIMLLQSMPHPAAHDRLEALASGLENGSTNPAIALEVIEALQAQAFHGAAATRATGPTDPRLDPSVLAAGGDPEAGGDVFMHHEAAQCLRCHTVDGTGGTAGPDLTTVASRRSISHLIRSIIDPAAEITPGYGTITLRLNDGSVVGGILAEDKPGAYIVDALGARRSVPKDLVKSTLGPTSAMPNMMALLSPREIRDVVAYLATRQDPALGLAVEPGEGSPTGAAASPQSPSLALFPVFVVSLLAAAAVLLLVVAVRIGSRPAP